MSSHPRLLLAALGGVVFAELLCLVLTAPAWIHGSSALWSL